MKEVLLATTDDIPTHRIVKVLGLVRGNTIRARHLGRDVLAGLKSLVGGEIRSYTKMLTDSREQAIGRMRDRARKLGANAVVCMRLTTSNTMQGASEILAYGTAVIVEPTTGS